jgi:hypothetical protein
MDEGGNFLPSSSTPSTATAFNLWDEEEERRRQEQAARKQAQAKSVVWKAQPGEVQRKYVDQANQARKYLSSSFQPNEDPLVEYTKTAALFGGTDKLGQRLSDIKTVWDAYMRPFNGQGAIWNLAKSPYTFNCLTIISISNTKSSWFYIVNEIIK